MKKISRKTIIFFAGGLFTGFLAGVFTMHFLSQSAREQKALCCYSMGLEESVKDDYESFLMFSASSVLKPGRHAPHVKIAEYYEKKQDFILTIREYEKALSLFDPTQAG